MPPAIGFKLAVNLSPAQFWDRSLVETLAETAFPPERLEFEITETYLLRRPEAAAEVIARLRKHGIKIALDQEASEIRGSLSVRGHG